MSITVHFTKSFNGKIEQTFESFTHCREILRSYFFAPVYRMRTHQNEFGRVTHRELFAVMSDGSEIYIGGVTI